MSHSYLPDHKQRHLTVENKIKRSRVMGKEMLQVIVLGIPFWGGYVALRDQQRHRINVAKRHAGEQEEVL